MAARGEGKVSQFERREARLRPQHAEEYPGIEPGVWIPAGELAIKLVEHTHARRRLSLYTRTFDPRHFEFRGGEPAGIRPATARSRATDGGQRST
jgi:hypothetical protein